MVRLDAGLRRHDTIQHGFAITANPSYEKGTGRVRQDGFGFGGGDGLRGKKKDIWFLFAEWLKKNAKHP
jgi:hypothetical protein